MNNDKWILLPDGTLMHWKYIKRVRKNGKWRYYYDKEALKDDLGGSQKKLLEYATDQRDKTAADKRAAEEKLRDSTNKPSGSLSENAARRKVLQKQVDQLNDSLLSKQKNVVYAEEQYKKTPLYKLEKLDKRIDKAKKWFKSLFG